MKEDKKVLLVILDGLGLTDKSEGNALREAKPEFLQKLFQERPFSRLESSGATVGLPPGQMGNSEVGHLNLGAGRLVPHDITRINEAIESGSLGNIPTVQAFFQHVRESGKALHFIGLISNGGVHSHPSHVRCLLKLAKDAGLKDVFVHPFTDGRDTSPTEGVHFIKELVATFQELGIGKIATICGRYYAMDRDNRWDRIEKAYLAMVHGVGNRVSDPVIAMEASYKANITDEFVVPVVIESGEHPVAVINDGDALLAFNFRADRMQQIMRAFCDASFPFFKRKDIKVYPGGLTRYSPHFDFPVFFPPVVLKNVLGEVLAEHSLPQLRIAESEKFAPITYFFNGRREEPFALEERIKVPSPKVKTYDARPELGAFEIGDEIREHLRSGRFPVIVANFANCDLVGHTGNMEAAVAAIGTVDCVLFKVIPAAYDLGYDCIITGDHGNVEQMVDYETGEPFTENTCNPVPFCLLSRENLELRKDGNLTDVAPTILDLLRIAPPSEMTGSTLLVRKK
jgi:2,3-bisphosphoglycerate-independent phosphoglycerate mutase